MDDAQRPDDPADAPLPTDVSSDVGDSEAGGADDERAGPTTADGPIIVQPDDADAAADVPASASGGRGEAALLLDGSTPRTTDVDDTPVVEPGEPRSRSASRRQPAPAGSDSRADASPPGPEAPGTKERPSAPAAADGAAATSAPAVDDDIGSERDQDTAERGTAGGAAARSRGGGTGSGSEAGASDDAERSRSHLRYENRTVEELRDLARKRDLDRRSQLNKAELVDALRADRGADSRDHYDDKPINELRALAAQRDRQRSDAMTKEQLLAALRS